MVIFLPNLVKLPPDRGFTVQFFTSSCLLPELDLALQLLKSSWCFSPEFEFFSAGFINLHFSILPCFSDCFAGAIDKPQSLSLLWARPSLALLNKNPFKLHSFARLGLFRNRTLDLLVTSMSALLQFRWKNSSASDFRGYSSQWEILSGSGDRDLVRLEWDLSLPPNSSQSPPFFFGIPGFSSHTKGTTALVDLANSDKIEADRVGLVGALK
jgi:hypothetical protein